MKSKEPAFLSQDPMTQEKNQLFAVTLLESGEIPDNKTVTGAGDVSPQTSPLVRRTETNQYISTFDAINHNSGEQHVETVLATNLPAESVDIDLTNCELLSLREREHEDRTVVLKFQDDEKDANDNHLIKMNLFIGLRFILGLYIWSRELSTPIKAPYRYYNWHHSVTGLPTSILIVFWKSTELYLRKERNWPYSSWASMLSLCGSILFFVSGVLAHFDNRIQLDRKASSTICFLVGLGIVCLANAVEALRGILSMLSANMKSWRKVIASLLQTGAFLLLIFDVLKKKEFLRGFSAFAFVLEGIVLSGSEMSTRNSFLHWTAFFKIIGSTTFVVGASTFYYIFRLNSTFSDFPPFFPMERGLVMPFYYLLAVLWFDIDMEASKTNQIHRLMVMCLLQGGLPTILVLFWIRSTSTSSTVRVVEQNSFRNSPTLIISCALLSLLSLISFFLATRSVAINMNKQRSLLKEEEDMVLPLNKKTAHNYQENFSRKVKKNNQTENHAAEETTSFHREPKHTCPTELSNENEIVSNNARNKVPYDNSEVLAVFGPAGDLFKFVATLLCLYLSYFLYFELGKKDDLDSDFDKSGNQLMLLSIGIGILYLLHSFCWIKVNLDMPGKNEDKQRKYTLSEDTYTLIMFARPLSQSWLLGFAVFALQATLTAMVLVAEIDQVSGKNNVFHAPYNVNASTRVGQVAGMVIILFYQSDYWSASTLLEIRFLGQVKDMGILFPATIRLTQSLGVVVASTILILQSDSIIDLVKDYTAILFISEIDDFVFTLADNGYLGRGLKHDAEAVKEREVDDVSEHPIRSIGFMSIFGAMMGCWVYVMNNQINGTLFASEFPGCVKILGKRVEPLLFGDGKCHQFQNFEECEFDGGDCVVQNMIGQDKVLHFFLKYPNCTVQHMSYIGNGRCDGGPYNTKECGFDGKDCDKFNSEYPNCNVTNPSWVGDGICDGDIKIMNGTSEVREYHNEECHYDGGDCAPTKYPKCIIYNPYEDIFSTGISRLESGGCSKKINTEECDWDGGDCLQFNKDYPGCDAEEPHFVADKICNGGLAYLDERCERDGGDCDAFVKKYPNCNMTVYTSIGDDICTSGAYNNIECGFEGGDCIEFNSKYPDCKVDHPRFIGNRHCDREYDTPECEWDGGDCND